MWITLNISLQWQWVGYIKQQENSQFAMMMYWKQEKWASMDLSDFVRFQYAVVSTKNSPKKDNRVRDAPKA